MSEYRDIRCGEDLDPFGRDAEPLEVLSQDLYHFVITNPFSLLRDPDWGFGIESYLGRPLPSTLAVDIENAVNAEFSDRLSNARCTIVPIAGENDAFRFELSGEVDGNWLDGITAVALRPTGAERL